MRKHRHTAGLEQLRPPLSKGYGKHSRMLGREFSFSHRAGISTSHRKVKITLPRISCLERPPEVD